MASKAFRGDEWHDVVAGAWDEGRLRGGMGAGLGLEEIAAAIDVELPSHVLPVPRLSRHGGGSLRHPWVASMARPRSDGARNGAQAQRNWLPPSDVHAADVVAMCPVSGDVAVGADDGVWSIWRTGRGASHLGSAHVTPWELESKAMAEIASSEAEAEQNYSSSAQRRLLAVRSVSYEWAEGSSS